MLCTNTARKRPCDPGGSYLVLEGGGCENLHLFDLRGSCEQFVGTSSQRLRNLTAQVSIATAFICESVEDTELSGSKPDRIPFQGSVFTEREGLSRLQKCFGVRFFARACFERDQQSDCFHFVALLGV